MSKVPRCGHCGEVIGVYEPLVTLLDGRPQETSRVRDPDIVEHADECYHRACFERPGD